MKIQTFRSKSKPLRRSLGVLAAPKLFVLPEIEASRPSEEEKARIEAEKAEVGRYKEQVKKQKIEKSLESAGAEKESSRKDRNKSSNSMCGLFLLEGKEEIVEKEEAVSAACAEGSLNKESKGLLKSPELLSMQQSQGNARQVKWSSFSHLPLKSLRKLGESTFSEVFIDNKTMHVYKIVPLTRNKNYVKVQHTKIDHFIKECLIMEIMNASEYSAEIFDWHIISEPYPKVLLAVSRKWHRKNPEIAENVIPQKNNSSSMFGVISMEYGGCELEKLEWSSFTQKDVLCIEQEIEKCIKDMTKLCVEHRDLHESNLLVSKTKEGQYKIKVIDYSLAQAVLCKESSNAFADILHSKKGSIIYRTGSILYTDIDREMPWLFTGDSEQSHREIYKKMNKCYLGKNRWKSSGPSNNLWKMYLKKWMRKQIETNT